MDETGLLHHTVAGDGLPHHMGVTHPHHHLGILDQELEKTKEVGHEVGLCHHLRQLGQKIEVAHL